MEPGEAVADPLDQKIQAGMLKKASGFNPFSPSKPASSSPSVGTAER